MTGKQLLVLFSLLCCACGSGLAQTRGHSLRAGWGVGIPVGEKYIDGAGVGNFFLEWDLRITPSLSAGASVGYNSLSDRGFASERFDSSLVTGYREKSLSCVPLMVMLDLFPLGDEGALLRPYIGVGAGVGYAKFSITGESIVTSSVSGWAENFAARAGTRIYPAENGRFFLDTGIVWSYGANGWEIARIGSVQTLGVTVSGGVMF
jgi:hypothetical protein